MTEIEFTSFHVKRFRSLIDVEVNLSKNSPVIICGENNIGKTNFLRALNLFFNHKNDVTFRPEEDVPYHIYEGSRGTRVKTELIGKFTEGQNSIEVKLIFDLDKPINYKLNNRPSSFEEIKNVISKFKFIFIEAHNVDLPKLIASVLEKDVLKSLDRKRAKQSRSLEKLEEFISSSEDAIRDIEKDINSCFEKLTDFDGILKGKRVKINFVEFERLRDVVKTMTEITLLDGNSLSIASKGSGAQRALFLALMQYISQNSREQVIWGIDEPEAFLQPKLQKKVAHVFLEVIRDQNQRIILTTHSQHFIDLSNLGYTYLFEGKQEEKEYARRPGYKFFEMNTSPVGTASDFEKASLIKEHLGITGNDGWQVMPYNILVEGEEDKKYLEALLNLADIAAPNIIWTGGASKIAGYLQFYNSFAQDLPYKPKILCLFDNDPEGREQAHKIKQKALPYLEVNRILVPRFDGRKCEEIPQGEAKPQWEIEDFVPPNIILKAVNFILRRNQYKVISKKQIDDRSQPAHIDIQILKYAEHCSLTNNPGKSPLIIDNEGRKKEICKEACQLLGNESNHSIESQFNFLKGISY